MSEAGAEKTETLLRLTNVGKDYAKVNSAGSRMRLVWDLVRNRGAAQAFQALDDVSFEVRRGQSLGVIGENGAGKSTLLKMIAGVVKPTRGTIEINGRVGALLELGSGFHPEYTGLANIDLAAALFGLDAAAIREKRDDIIAFADLGEHIHDPIKTYSSGMVVRLGFAVATALSPEILITDEVLAVGDESFQKKCVTWIEGYLKEGGTLLLCSHSMYHIQKLCRSALWLKGGKVERYGSAAEVSQAYLAYHEARERKEARPPEVGALTTVQEGEYGFYALKAFEMVPQRVPVGQTIRLDGEVYSPDGRSPVIMVGVMRGDGTPVYGVSTEIDGVGVLRSKKEKLFEFSLKFTSLKLLPGQYYIRVHVFDPEAVRLFDTLEKTLWVEGETREMGIVRLDHKWQ